MAYTTDAITELTTLIDNTWTDLTIIYRSNQIQRQNWNNFVDEFQKAGNSGFGPPYCIVDIGTLTPDLEFSGLSNSAKNIPVSIYYVGLQKTTTTEMLEDRCQLLSHALEATGHTAFQVTGYCSYDYSPSNPANSVFLVADIPMYAAMVTANLLIGEDISFG